MLKQYIMLFEEFDNDDRNWFDDKANERDPQAYANHKYIDRVKVSTAMDPDQLDKARKIVAPRVKQDYSYQRMDNAERETIKSQTHNPELLAVIDALESDASDEECHALIRKMELTPDDAIAYPDHIKKLIDSIKSRPDLEQRLKSETAER